MQHTPTPWRLEYDPTARGNPPTVIMQQGAEIYEKFIAEARWGKDGDTDEDGDGIRDCTAAEAQANAAFIVRACNAHDDLLAALEDVIRQFVPSRDVMDAAQRETFQFARAALAKAKGTT